MPSAATRYVQISNFKWGLDSRRSELLDQPGALVMCQNAHINQGGEIEQRKSFAKQVGVASVNTFGFETTATGIVRFGSALVEAVTLPAGMIYRKCDHPTGFKIGGAAAAMTGVLASTNFNGEAFVLAQFDDGNIFAYLGDVSPMPLVAQITRDGKVLYIATGPEALFDLANDLTIIFGQIGGFTVISNQNELGSVINGDVTLLTDPGIHLAFVPSAISAAGVIQAKLIDSDVAIVSLQSASASFFLSTGAAGSVTLTAPANIGGSGTAQLTGGAVPFHTSLMQTAADIVSKVNSLTNVTGYTATNGIGLGVNIFAPKAWGNFTFNLTITLVTITIVSGGTDLTAQFLDSNNLPISSVVVQDFGTTIHVAVTGLTGSATYTWSVTNSVGTIILSPSGSVCGLIRAFQATVSGTVSCVIIDGPTGATITISISATGNR